MSQGVYWNTQTKTFHILPFLEHVRPKACTVIWKWNQKPVQRKTYKTNQSLPITALESIQAPAPLPVPSHHVRIPAVHTTANWSSYVFFTIYSKSDLKPLSKRWNDFSNNILMSYMLSSLPISQTLKSFPKSWSWKPKLRAWNEENRGSLCTVTGIMLIRKT